MPFAAGSSTPRPFVAPVNGARGRIHPDAVLNRWNEWFEYTCPGAGFTVPSGNTACTFFVALDHRK